MSKAADTGKSFIDGVLAKLPESLRDQAKAVFSAPEATDALTLVGDGVLARADYSRQMDEIRTKEQQVTEDFERLNTWYEEKKSALAELDEFRTGKKKPANGDPPPPRTTPEIDPTKFLSREDFQKSQREEQLAAANYLGLQNVLTLQHYDRFKEILDTRELLADPNLGKQKADGSVYGLTDAYRTKHGEKLTAWEQQQEQARITKLVDEQVAERMKANPGMPIPLRGAPSVLDLIEAGTEIKPEQYSAAAAAEEYARLQAARG